MSNSERLHSLLSDGKLHLSLQDTIELALENNLDIAVARYNIAFSQTDILRTQGGGAARGFTGIVPILGAVLRRRRQRCQRRRFRSQWRSGRGFRQRQRHAIGGRHL